MIKAIFIVDTKKHMVKADTDMSAFQLYNETIIEDSTHKKNTWYPINGAEEKGKDGYGYWVLHNEFPNTKGGEFITVKYI